MEVEIKPAEPLAPEFGALPVVVEKPKAEPKREEVPAPKYTAQVIIVALLIAASAIWWHFGLKPQLDAFARECQPAEVRQ